MRTNTARIPGACVALLALVGGCANLSLRRPTASFRSMSVDDVTGRGFTMNVDVDVENPNSVALPLAGLDYSLDLEGIEVNQRGKVRGSSRIPASGSETITVPVPVTFANLLQAEEAIRRGGGDVSYRLDAGLSFDTGTPLLGDLRVPFEHRGTLSVQKILRQNWGAILSSPEARRLAQRVLGGLPF
jgi:LEA14-like dessication related protein